MSRVVSWFSCGAPIYLDELDPKRGRIGNEPIIEFGIFCHAVEQVYKK